MISLFLQLAVSLVFILTLFFILISLSFRFVKWKAESNPTKFNVAFFHPYCNAGGGGERVLWQLVEAALTENENTVCTIFTGDRDSPSSILALASSRFNLPLSHILCSSSDVSRCSPRVRFVVLSSRILLSGSLYPFLTLFFQSLGSMIVAFECVCRCIIIGVAPHVIYDSMGYAFTYPVFKLLSAGSVTIAAYVHYPTISRDMLNRVLERRPTYNNNNRVTNSVSLSSIKLFYYKLFARAYGFVGKISSFTVTNSSWTKNHIDTIWNVNSQIMYPPCDVSTLSKIPLNGSPEARRAPHVVSIAQFRPEKDHQLQIRAFHKALTKIRKEEAEEEEEEAQQNHDASRSDYKLIMIGGVRDKDDQQRVANLKNIVKELQIENDVSFLVNAPSSDVHSALSTALIGIHTMWNEHFGIGVVEFMAAGVIVLAHNSGGPKSDIVVPLADSEHSALGVTGFLADDVLSYSEIIYKIFKRHKREESSMKMSLSADDDVNIDRLESIRARARSRSHCFSDEKFLDQAVEHFNKIRRHHQTERRPH